MYICYTDGSFKSSRGEHGTGGWSSIICDSNGSLITELYGGLQHTTSNRMEIMGVLETLRYFKTQSDIQIISDSQYVVESISNGYVQSWVKNNSDRKNMDLWKQIVPLLNFHNVTLKWTKGHATNKMNNLADYWAQFAARCLNLPEDEYTDNCEESRESLVPESESRGSNGNNVGFKNGKILYSFG